MVYTSEVYGDVVSSVDPQGYETYYRYDTARRMTEAHGESAAGEVSVGYTYGTSGRTD